MESLKAADIWRAALDEHDYKTCAMLITAASLEITSEPTIATQPIATRAAALLSLTLNELQPARAQN
jgi:hypothetical protein